jgi:hypothetical protein
MEEGISVREAAAILGTTERAVRFRLQRKTLKGQRVDGKWWVWLTETDVPHTGNSAVAVADRESVPEWFSAVVQQSLTQAEEIGRLKAVIEEKDRVIANLLESTYPQDEEEPRPGFWAWLFGR